MSKSHPVIGGIPKEGARVDGGGEEVAYSPPAPLIRGVVEFRLYGIWNDHLGGGGGGGGRGVISGGGRGEVVGG